MPAGFLVFYLLSRYAVKKHGSHECFFAFVKVLYREHKYQSTSDGHKSHLCFLIFANRKTNRGWFCSLFVFPTEWHQTGKQTTAYTEEVVFLFFSYLMLRTKNENRYSGSYFNIPFSVFQIRKKEKEIWLPYSYFSLWNRRMINERTVYTKRDCFPFILFSSCKKNRKNWYNGSYFCFSLFGWGLAKRKKDA